METGEVTDFRRVSFKTDFLFELGIHMSTSNSSIFRLLDNMDLPFCVSRILDQTRSSLPELPMDNLLVWKAKQLSFASSFRHLGRLSSFNVRTFEYVEIRNFQLWLLFWMAYRGRVRKTGRSKTRATPRKS